MAGTSRAETEKHEYASVATKLTASLRLNTSAIQNPASALDT